MRYGTPPMELIKNLYKPIQPNSNGNGNVFYAEYKPHPNLQNVVFCYWHLYTTQPLSSAYTYRVVADGCIDIIIDSNNPSDIHVMGFCDSFSEFTLTEQFCYVGIRFFPSMFPQSFGIKAKEISNKTFELHSISRDLCSCLEDTISNIQVFNDVASSLDSCLLKFINPAHFNLDPRFYGAVFEILNKRGLVSVEGNLSTVVSSRQLLRFFDYYIGTSPKTFSKVVRFQSILTKKSTHQTLRKEALFYDYGYSDQSHFIREFKTLYGLTPGKAFR